ncbi:Response regulator receiver domain-containing protein [Nakamurella panacisegetis]|uniref:Response regulator receiver domain-containing protein n=1 Tax=Nakamurella panacisegetis TaxID=1090615 RepID=A0A1H0IR17_9ACTN|nr:response regulator [Nakamurella panacisegetis]SDO33894.1 Response regulator receiver domain-containing protein [Nakamurella panacisegetis]
MTAASVDRTVVIADDDLDIRLLVETAVRRAGLTVVASVGDGSAALLAVQRFRPDLVILDVSMPGMTGLEVCRSMRQEPATALTPVLIVSAAVHPAALQAAADAGVTSHVQKPFGVKLLVQQIASLLPPEAPTP